MVKTNIKNPDGVRKRLGIDYETLKQNNPRLIYCSITGYGQDGPYKDSALLSFRRVCVVPEVLDKALCHGMDNDRIVGHGFEEAPAII